MTTTTANAAQVMQHLEFCHQVLWPELDVQMASVTEQWAQFSVAGPRSRDVLRKLVDPRVRLSNEAFPYLAARRGHVSAAIAGAALPLSFSGELAYEIAVPARYGDAAIRAIMAAGEALGIAPYGTEALGVMRIEKGHVAGQRAQRADHRARPRPRPHDVDEEGLRRPGDGAAPGAARADRPTLVGFKPSIARSACAPARTSCPSARPPRLRTTRAT